MKNDRQAKSTTYIIIAFALMAIIIVAIIVIFYKVNGSSKNNNPNVTSYTDPGSGETVVHSPDKETFNVNPNQPVYLGFTKFLDVGFTNEQVDNLKAAFLDFATQQVAQGKEKITEISVTTSSVNQSTDSSTGDSTCTFDFTVNRKTKYQAAVTSPDITSVTLNLYGEDGSGPLFTETKGLPQ